MEPFVPALWTAVSLLVGVTIWWRNAPAPLTGLRLFRTTERDIESLVAERPDRACFVGTVVDAESLIEGPFSGEQGVAVGYEVLEEEPTVGWSVWHVVRNPFRQVARGSAAAPFTLDDGTGKVRVDPDGAQFRLAADAVIGVLGGTTPPERIRQFIAADDGLDDEDRTVTLGPVDLTAGYDRKYIERRVEPGDKLLVCGAVSEERATTGRRPVAGTIPATVTGGEPFLLADSSRQTVARSLLLGNPVWVLVSLGCLALASYFGWLTLTAAASA